ncbi:MAG: GAF domain-containing protein, partial [Anaerolineae bacterium]|nr:GAF domain-containing protein [Anaerolineae bacterium]
MSVLPNLNAARILVAENTPDDMDHTAGILENAGYNITKAYFAGDALFALEHARFDLAVIDARMADPAGQPLIDQMAQFAPVGWIALVKDENMILNSLLGKGALGYVQRPVRPDALLRQVHASLGTHPRLLPSPPVPRERSDFSQLLERRLIEQQTLSALARSLSAVLDLDTLLTQVVDAAVRLCNAEEGLLLLPDDDRKTLYVRAAKGMDSETARNFRIKTQDTLAGQVFRSGTPILVGDQGWQKVKTEYLVKSLLYVPLSLKGEIVGVLGINNRQAERTFSPHDIDLLQDLAAHAVIAIENARLYEESLLRTRELSTLVQAGEAANSTLAIDRVLSIIAGQLIAALNVSLCFVAEWEPDNERLHMLAVSYRALWSRSNGPGQSIWGDPSVERAINEQRVVVAAPPSQSAAHSHAAWMPHHHFAQAAEYVPVFTQKRLLGLVTFYHIDHPCPERAYQHARQVALWRAATDATLVLSQRASHANPAAMLDTAQLLIQNTGANWCEIALTHANQRQPVVALSYGETIWQEDKRPALSLADYPSVAQILTDQTTLTSTGGDDLGRLANVVCGKSALALPLVIKGQTAGLVLLVDTLHAREFSRRDIELAQALVLQAANALDNARLYRDLEISLDELRRTQSKLVQTARLSAMGELAAAVAHQINNPLTTILGDAELLLKDLLPDDP